MLGEYQINDPKRAGKTIVFLFLLLLAVLGLTLVIFYFTKINQAASSESVPTNISIERGSKTKEVASLLDNENVINSPWAFLTYVKLSGASGKIQAGEYVLNPKMSIVEIVDILTAGKATPNEKKVTIIEGWTNSQIANYLEQRNIAAKEEFDRSLRTVEYNFKFQNQARIFNYQGFLFPDTYLLSKDGGSGELIEKMLKDFEKRLTDKMIQDLEAKNLKIGDVIILASIIEKEVGRPNQTLSLDDFRIMQEERKIIASVFYNRLKLGVALHSDATINYITGKNDRQAKLKDTKVKSPYNTYLYPGLPPTPISNPGIDSIMAAIYPADTDYLYFLNKENGEAVYAKTLEEHNANKAKYLK